MSSEPGHFSGTWCACGCGCDRALDDGNGMRQLSGYAGAEAWQEPPANAIPIYTLVCAQCFVGEHANG